MKTRYVIGAAVASLGLLFSACQPEEVLRDPSPVDDNQVQAFIYNNTGDITIRPADGDSVVITWAGGTFTSAEPAFPVVVGRNISNEALSLQLEFGGDVEAFILDSVADFAAGQAVDTLWMTALLGFGESASLSVAIPEGCAFSYAPSSVTLAVSADYTWLPMGSVTLSSEWEGVEGVVPIEQAKEFTAEDGSLLFRLNSPYYYIAPEWCTVPGLHLFFYLNADYSAKDLTTTWNEVENTGYNWIYWTEKYIGTYELFASEGNEYALTCLWTDGESLYGPVTESWVWDNGYPGN
ncbi:MAG: hypothetical protein ACI4BD_05195 [Paludibacteraceae bacterium]